MHGGINGSMSEAAEDNFEKVKYNIKVSNA